MTLVSQLSCSQLMADTDKIPFSSVKSSAFLHQCCQSLWDCGKLAVFSSSCERWDGSCDQGCGSRSSKRGYWVFLMWRIIITRWAHPLTHARCEGSPAGWAICGPQAWTIARQKRRRRKTAWRELRQQVVLLLTSEKKQTISQILGKKRKKYILHPHIGFKCLNAPKDLNRNLCCCYFGQNEPRWNGDSCWVWSEAKSKCSREPKPLGGISCGSAPRSTDTDSCGSLQGTTVTERGPATIINPASPPLHPATLPQPALQVLRPANCPSGCLNSAEHVRLVCTLCMFRPVPLWQDIPYSFLFLISLLCFVATMGKCILSRRLIKTVNIQEHWQEYKSIKSDNGLYIHFTNPLGTHKLD